MSSPLIQRVIGAALVTHRQESSNAVVIAIRAQAMLQTVSD